MIERLWSNLRARAAQTSRMLVQEEVHQDRNILHPLPQRQHGAAGTATIAIRDYQMTVECDQRWYGAKLISARATPLVVAKARDGALAGC